MTSVGDLCTKEVVVAGQSEGLTEVARRMLDRHVGCVVVVHDEQGVQRPIGMLTDRDMVVGVLSRTARGLHLLTVGDVMSLDIVTARQSEPFEHALERMHAHGIRRIPVVDDHGGLFGLLSVDDWVGFLAKETQHVMGLLTLERKLEAKGRGTERAAAPAQPSAETLEQYARGKVVVLAPETLLYDAIRALDDNHIGAIVVHDGERVVGIVTDRDVALRTEAYRLDPGKTTLSDIMTPDVAVLPPRAGLGDALRLMRDRHVRRIPLVVGNAVQGVVTLDDLIVAERVALAPLAEVVRAQLGESTRHEPRGEGYSGSAYSTRAT